MRGSCRAQKEQSDARKGRGKQLHFSLLLENSYHAPSAELTMAGRPAAGWKGPSSKEMLLGQPAAKLGGEMWVRYKGKSFTQTAVRAAVAAPSLEVPKATDGSWAA